GETFTVDDDGKKKVKITIQTAIDRLIESGLDTSNAGNFTGKFKFFHCYSGLRGMPRQPKPIFQNDADAKDTYDKLVQEGLDSGLSEEKAIDYAERRVYIGQTDPRPTAQKGADHLRSLGFNQAQFFGYKGPLQSLYEFANHPLGSLFAKHKYVRQQ